MVWKIIQWVPIDGTRWRNEVVNGHEDYGVGGHYGVAPDGDMAPLRKLPNTSGLGGLCGRRHGSPRFNFIKHRIGTHYGVDSRPDLGEQVTVRL
jgi:hypothetical protein